MINPDFNKNSAAVCVSLILAVLFLFTACFVPEAFICKVYNSTVSHIDAAVEAVGSDDFNSASEHAKTVFRFLNENSEMLKLFFNHSDVYQLLGSAESAYLIAQKEDAAQLYEELCSVKTILEVMKRSNEASLINLF